jgi:hypothetical protein
MAPLLLVATRKGLFTLERDAAAGPAWKLARTAFLGDPVTMVLAVEGGCFYAALDLGHFGVKLHRSADAGRSWQEIAAPQYPPKPEALEDRDPFSGYPVPWTLKRIWSLERADPARAEALWCGTLPGGLFRSDDGGDTWQLMRALWDHPKRREWAGGGADWAGIHSICVDPRDPASVVIGVSVGGVWVTSDAGASWAPSTAGMRAEYMPPERTEEPSAQDPHRIVRCASAPDTLWAQHHNGVFRSTDAGASWQELETLRPSAFGFAVAVHPHDPGTAWFVPATKDERRYPVDAQVVVARTRDGGASFEVLRTGLPQEHAYDLVYRHALDVDDSGATLAFGSTTGSLWISEDQGERWQQISAHLPPIYCVRFAS